MLLLLNLQVLILSEKLHSVTARFDQLRAIRFQDAINKRIPRRKLNRAANKNTTTVYSSKTNNLEFSEPDDIQPESLRVQQQVLDDETRALQVIRISIDELLTTFSSMGFFNCSDGSLRLIQFELLADGLLCRWN
jgi:hypothetical protein